ncbi:MAG: tryptophan-rich sensory protein [Flavobacteriales bacterium]|nr:tryptophan-rich sensory protein [Flavobacteriales bacterium]
MIRSLLVYGFIHFSALAIGGIATSRGVREWYPTLQLAPWTPPGWFFGFAWTTIMVLLTILCAKTIPLNRLFQWGNPLITFYWIHLLLNIAWNYCFFWMRSPALGLIELSLFYFVLVVMSYYFIREWKASIFFLLPYLLWGLVALSLNTYIWIKN